MIKQSGKTLTKKAITDIDQAYLQELGLTKSMIYETGPCPRPEILTEGQIKSTLEERNLSSNGTRSELNARLTQDNYACSNATLPAIQNSTIASIIHYSIDSDCLRIETCADIPLNISGNIYSKSLKVTFDVEPCSFLS
eukprot:XP_019923403.1 PREDICTED: uncharacterized protein LOC105329784 [Crassostrea gigas]